MKIEIKCHFSDKVLFEHDAEDNTLRLTVEAGVKVRADLRGADLRGADLRGADLGGTYLRGAYLRGAYLRGAYLRGADLRGADLYGADLYGADLRGAYLRGADLGGADLYGADLYGADLRGADLGGTYLRGAYLEDKSKLVGKRPILQIGPIGSRCAYFVAYLTDKGLRLRAGCFFGTRAEFEKRLIDSDETTQIEYRAALSMIDTHAELWTPKETT